MPFCLKNAGAIYQRLVNKMFKDHSGKTIEVYIHDMPVTSLQVKNHLEHLRDTIETIQKVQHEAKLREMLLQSGLR